MEAGSIKLYIGPMFSGKTESLVRDLDRYTIGRHRKRVVIVRPLKDNRYVEQETTGIMLNSGREYLKAPIVVSETLGRIDADIMNNYDVIGITETQFFPDIEYIDSWANKGKIVICDGLKGRTDNRPMGRILELIPMCEQVIDMKAVCEHCSKDASFTSLRNKQQPAGEKVAGIDEYLATCRSCKLNE